MKRPICLFSVTSSPPCQLRGSRLSSAFMSILNNYIETPGRIYQVLNVTGELSLLSRSHLGKHSPCLARLFLSNHPFPDPEAVSRTHSTQRHFSAADRWQPCNFKQFNAAFIQDVSRWKPEVVWRALTIPLEGESALPTEQDLWENAKFPWYCATGYSSWAQGSARVLCWTVWR